MEAWVLDESLKAVRLVDNFESLIWTERYCGAGNFELYTPMDINLYNSCKQDYYMWLKDSEMMMIIEDVKITTEVETGGHLTISGRSLESILDRRIIWVQTVINGNLQNGIKKLLNDNVISPSIADRKISNFKFVASTDTTITGLTLRAQYTGDNLYDTIVAICTANKLGFKVTFNQTDNTFNFLLYNGSDRSYDQDANPYVIFSPKYENIINSNYLDSKKTLKNITLVAGEDEGTARRTRIVGSGSALGRRELYTDARDIQSEVTDDDGTQRKLSDDEYNAQLDQRGKEKLAEHTSTKTFEGQVESQQSFKFNEDFFTGDVVQIVNEYGIESKVRVTEVVRAQDTTGYEMYPNFSVEE